MSPPFLHVVHMREQEDFHPKETIADLADVDVSLREDNDQLRVLPRDPSRKARPRTMAPLAVELPLQQPGRDAGLDLLARHLQIAYGHDVAPDAFLGVPTYHVDERGHLR
ncbi:hypothetical protein [Actinopolymorpha pittospori]|uniref:LytS/YehU family sensor histidine kinase n=1 Tax=Actinopolymorpha pittospori TaxID=648752 RepID=A0A927MNL3_9ACTN|nr:hypothetical protein [Actinopolymorpha pittospori]MBE1603834.1 LytS/YehU family sensor histidine kinase [Actinopolymorpha pittospori]